MKSNNKVLGRWERLRDLVSTGMTIGIVSAGVFLSLIRRGKIPFIIDNKLAQFPLNYLSVILLLATIILALQWIRGVRGELQMLKDCFGEFIPKTPRSSFQITISLAVTISILCVFSNIIFIYSIVFGFYKLVEIWGIRIRDSQLTSALKHARKERSEHDERQEDWAIIENYYLKKPQIQLAITVSLVSFTCFALGLLGYFYSKQIVATWLLAIAYSGMIGILIINETVYAIWRRKRDNKLQESYS